ncbi:unnamed protein product [Spirodela intermedia]|nr:unnamed protein product [Spirodela intermedia]
MATHRKTPAAVAAAILLLLIGAAAVGLASASTLTLYWLLGCRVTIRGSCGVCYNIGPVYKGYFFNYFGGQVARFYPRFNCQGPYDLIRRNIRCCRTPCQ